MKVSMPHTGRRQEQRGRLIPHDWRSGQRRRNIVPPQNNVAYQAGSKQTPGFCLEPGLNQAGRHVP